MRPENEARLAKIKKLSWLLRAICILFMIFPVHELLIFVIGPFFRHGPYWGNGILLIREYGIEFKVYSLTLRDRLLTLTLLTLTCTSAFLCILQFFRLLGFYSRGEIFTAQSVRQIRLWAYASMAWGAIKTLWIFVPHLVANSRRREDLDLSTIFNGLIIIVISWFMAMAAEMREENELTV